MSADVSADMSAAMSAVVSAATRATPIQRWDGAAAGKGSGASGSGT